MAGIRHPRILVIDDNAADVFLIKVALESSNIATELIVCSDGEVAVRYLHGPEMQNPPDAIILDLCLPKVDGVDVLREILCVPKFSDIPIMVFTSSASPSDKHRVELLTGGRYVQKPIDLDDFIHEVTENVQCMFDRKAKAKSERS
jgi:CheY-like chemotaxis protein